MKHARAWKRSACVKASEVDPGRAQHRLVDLARHIGREEHDQPVRSAAEQPVHAVEQVRERSEPRFGAVMGLARVLEQAVHILERDEAAIQLRGAHESGSDVNGMMAAFGPKCEAAVVMTDVLPQPAGPL